ncbi:hypothetical protein NFI96_028292 [Prochilodus magdalenae]|nr:hypothetical protein NFI96_028292 [Prochilodus magdalenae]
MAAEVPVSPDGGEDTYVVCDSQSMVHSSTSAEEDLDGPAVFLCGQCRLPVGDTLSWAGSDEELNQIMLKKVSDNIVVGREPYVSSSRTEPGCLVVNLTCRGCSSILGLVYTSTPKALDFKRLLFCFGVQNIERYLKHFLVLHYVLGSAKQQMAAVGREVSPVTLEFAALINQQMTQPHYFTCCARRCRFDKCAGALRLRAADPCSRSADARHFPV